jgi:hypothetical protein
MDMSVDVLRNNLTNPAKSYLWATVFPKLIGGGDGTALAARCQSAGLPGRATQSIKIPFRGTPGFKVPGKAAMTQTWSLDFLESTADKKTFTALYNWQQVINNTRTGLGSPDPLVKTDLYFQCLDQAGATWLSIKLVGCYLESMGDISTSYGSNSTMIFSATFSYDWWELVT